jgi:hypothetical protein
VNRNSVSLGRPRGYVACYRLDYLLYLETISRKGSKNPEFDPLGVDLFSDTPVILSCAYFFAYLHSSMIPLKQ